MHIRKLILPGLAALLLAGTAPAQVDCSVPIPGPDVIVGSLPGVGNFGGTGGVGAYSLATTSCNIGTETLKWISGTNEHPVIGQNFYRMENDRFEQIGMIWLKHGFFALQQSLCCNCTPHPNGTALGVGCSDPYSASLNGSQGGLGPRFQVNAFTGDFSYPFFAQGSGGNQIYKRGQILNSDLDPSLHPTALYFGEGHYVSPDDAAAGNHFNNASYRRLTVGGFTSGSWNLSATGPTERTKPGLQAWADNDPAVRFAPGKVPGEGRFFGASKVIDNGDGTWRYEYAIQNLNSDVSFGSFAVPVPAGVTVTGIGFGDVDYHSGEPYDGTDWVGQHANGEVRWSTAETFGQNPNANALRWGSLYNFWFVADANPGVELAELATFKPHVPATTGIQLDAPSLSETWVDLGGGTTGVTGQPLLTMSGTLTPASQVTLDLTNAAPLELSLTLLSFSSTPIGYVGGTLHPVPWDALFFFNTSGTGTLNGSTNFSGAPSGTQLFAQVAVVDASVPLHGVALSNGVVGTVP